MLICIFLAVLIYPGCFFAPTKMSFAGFDLLGLHGDPRVSGGEEVEESGGESVTGHFEGADGRGSGQRR